MREAAMPIRMITADLDGTLLRGDKSISAYTAGVLKRLRARGGKVVVATATVSLEGIQSSDI